MSADVSEGVATATVLCYPEGVRYESTREPAVAGMFYPASAAELRSLVARMVDAVDVPPRPVRPKAIIVPHAGYIYSGPIAASAFARVKPFADSFTRVVLVGPAHRVYVEGLVAPEATRLRTPLGELEVDHEALAELGVPANAAAHAREHSLEVELPFLQCVAPNARVVLPLIGSQAPPELVGAALEALWGGEETLIVVSSDLSHYLSYADARVVDEQTCGRILAAQPEIAGDRACGAIGINGLLWVARRRGLRVELLDLRSSGDTEGSQDEVVGYAAFAFYEESSS